MSRYARCPNGPAPGNPLYTARIQDGVNTVGPVPMTFGYGPNTFPQSAAHVLNTNQNPSPSEGVTINEIYVSAAQHIVKYMTLNMNHPIADGVKINNSRPNNKDTENVQNTSGATKCTKNSNDSIPKTNIQFYSTFGHFISIPHF